MILNIIKEIEKEEDVTILALALGYELEKEIETTKEMTVEKATEKGYKMTILEDTTMCIAVTGTKVVANDETPKVFIEGYYLEFVTKHGQQASIDYLNAGKKEKRAAEDKEIEELVKSKI